MYWEVFLKEEYFAFRIFILWTTLSNAKNTCISKWLVWTLLLYFYTMSYIDFEAYHKLQILASASHNCWFQLFVISNVFLCCLPTVWILKPKNEFQTAISVHACYLIFIIFICITCNETLSHVFDVLLSCLSLYFEPKKSFKL